MIYCMRCISLFFPFGQSEELIEEVRHVLCEAKADNVKADGNGPRTVGQQNTDDTAIVQSVGAPFAALQWREEDSLNNFRCGHNEECEDPRAVKHCEEDQLRCTVFVRSFVLFEHRQEHLLPVC